MCSGDEYVQQRNRLLNKEKEEFTGSRLNLTKNEEKVDRYLIGLKKEELNQSYKNFSVFLPARNFLIAREDIEKSQVSLCSVTRLISDIEIN